MKYQHRPEVKPELAEQSRKDIEAVNAYMDTLKGTVISIQRIRGGQPRPYADSVDEALIFCFHPNIWTTNGPCPSYIGREDAARLARLFVGGWEDDPKFLDSRLELLEPAPNPCGLKELGSMRDEKVRACCWRVIIRHPYCD